jgi:hypothetical protein
MVLTMTIPVKVLASGLVDVFHVKCKVQIWFNSFNAQWSMESNNLWVKNTTFEVTNCMHA